MTQTVQTLATEDFLSIALPLDSLPKQFTYNDDGNIETISTQFQGNPVGGGVVDDVTYTKTFTWEDGVMTNESQWVPQSD